MDIETPEPKCECCGSKEDLLRCSSCMDAYCEDHLLTAPNGELICERCAETYIVPVTMRVVLVASVRVPLSHLDNIELDRAFTSKKAEEYIADSIDGGFPSRDSMSVEEITFELE